MNTTTQRLFKIFIWLILLTGIALRLSLYLQNRNLFIDEANIARNLYERGFLGLTKTLSYEQYAPPIHIWILKLSSVLFGFSEYALRLWPLLISIAALYVFMLLLRETLSYKSRWYPLALLAGAFIIVRYASELKQYSGDTFITCLLPLLALRVNINETKPGRFILFWFLVGSLAIWFSMSSVFLLAGIGVYYFVICLQQKDYKRLTPLFTVSALWLLQFGFYYNIILKGQANSDYLQTTLDNYFFFLVPKNHAQLEQDRHLLTDIMHETSGFSVLNKFLNKLLVVIGCLFLLFKHRAKAALFVLPVALTILAASLRQYALMLRFTIFMMPLFMLLMGYGLEAVMSLKIKVWQIAIAVVALFSAYQFNCFRIVHNGWQNEEVTESMIFMQNHNVDGPHLYLHQGAMPAYIYYTQIHPDSSRWNSLKNAHYLQWNSSYDSVAQNAALPMGIIYTSISQQELHERNGVLSKYLKVTDSMEQEYGRKYAYIFDRK